MAAAMLLVAVVYAPVASAACIPSAPPLQGIWMHWVDDDDSTPGNGLFWLRYYHPNAPICYPNFSEYSIHGSAYTQSTDHGVSMGETWEGKSVPADANKRESVALLSRPYDSPTTVCIQYGNIQIEDDVCLTFGSLPRPGTTTTTTSTTSTTTSPPPTTSTTSTTSSTTSPPPTTSTTSTTNTTMAPSGGGTIACGWICWLPTLLAGVAILTAIQGARVQGYRWYTATVLLFAAAAAAQAWVVP